MKNHFKRRTAFKASIEQGVIFYPRQNRKLGVLSAGGLALMLMLNVAIASISTTKHNLGSTNSLTGSPNKFSGTAEICVFCHTPHGANDTIANPAPIWNRNFDAAGSYTTYDSLGTTSFDATAAPTGSVSLACLSCHDGTQAMNVMINTPGSGTTTTLAGIWTGAAATASPIGSLATAGKFTFIGVDLTNDHPISIQYGGGGISNSNGTTSATPASPLTNDPYFAQPTGNSTPNKRVTSTIGQVGTRVLKTGTRVWWVETNGTTGQQKDDLALYSRTDLGTNQPFVECASCHDPHSNNTTFLRHASGNEGSATCLTCHIK
jgi:hypothetical protein